MVLLQGAAQTAVGRYAAGNGDAGDAQIEGGSLEFMQQNLNDGMLNRRTKVVAMGNGKLRVVLLLLLQKIQNVYNNEFYRDK